MVCKLSPDWLGKSLRCFVCVVHPAGTDTNKITLKTLMKLHDRRKTTHNCRVMGSVWVLFLHSAHKRPIYPTHFVGNPYTSVSRLQLLNLMLNNSIGSSYMSDSFCKNVTYIELYMGSFFANKNRYL